MATEKRMISLDEAMEATHKEVWWTESEKAAVRSFLVKLPRADAVEAVHGYTLIADEPKKVLLDRKCSICDQLMLATDNYCPMCGAKNVGEKIDGLLFADMEEIIDA